jgi:hypothetical protein
VTAEGLERSRESLLRHLHFLRQQGTPETDIPLMLRESTDYAKYCIARMFGLIADDSGDEPLVAYQSVKSRFIEVMER